MSVRGPEKVVVIKEANLISLLFGISKADCKSVKVRLKIFREGLSVYLAK